MLSVPDFQDLRVIEVAKDSFGSIPDLLHDLGWRRQKFILFIDDLSFEEGDKNYSVLKVILEGGLEQRPQNVVLYATSNRRQLIKRVFPTGMKWMKRRPSRRKRLWPTVRHPDPVFVAGQRRLP
jgi:predicted AAA+ superfamily ATPase